MRKKLNEYLNNSKTINVLLQLVREMGIPFLISTAWVTYSLYSTPTKRNIVDATSIFGASFFLACWAFSQWFRVKKQQAVEGGLGNIVQRQEALVAALTEATERLEGQTSGGKSIGWLMLVNPRDGAIRNITAHVEGDYPLLEATAKVEDLAKARLGFEEFRRSGNIQDFFKYHVTFNCGTLQTNLATIQSQIVPCDTTKLLIRFRVEWTARNGKWTQYVELKRNGNRYEFYTAVQRNEEWVLENPPRDSIAKRADGKPDVFWHTGLAEALKEGNP
ncbi:hypothetical protein [Xanthomonas bonasiae]|uniref:hypothetical protein n=1 Tax=Xanthomonas bonasiae TaxID=2810351 RepID=UPI00197E8511|nr:hypothetical protein [Xanthomonas bonasiae]MBN6111547.1 hypothetical protein [Xanthomonas bonasiae]